MLLLTAHGLLHLLGFDHAEPEEEREMFGIQRDILVGFHARRTAAGRRAMMIALFVSVAVLLVAFGGLLAAADAALGALSRADLVDLASGSRVAAVAARDRRRHRRARQRRSTSCASSSETTAAVLVTLAFASSFDGLVVGCCSPRAI